MNRRILKLNKNLQRALMEYLMKRMKHNVPGFICVKETIVSPDLKTAKVYLSFMSEKDRTKQLQTNLEKERYFIQKAISHNLKIKFCPRLHFFINYVSCPTTTEKLPIPPLPSSPPPSPVNS